MKSLISFVIVCRENIRKNITNYFFSFGRKFIRVLILDKKRAVLTVPSEVWEIRTLIRKPREL